MRLRPYKKSDSEHVMLWLQDQRTVELWKADRFSWPLSEAQMESYWEDFQKDSHAFALTALDGEGKPVGHVSFREINYQENSVHMGFIITDPAVRGTGSGRRMVSLALTYAFTILGMGQVTLGVFDCNLAAKRCYESAGFKEIDSPHKTVVFQDETWEYYYMAATPAICT